MKFRYDEVMEVLLLVLLVVMISAAGVLIVEGCRV